eukprot:g34573.t1
MTCPNPEQHSAHMGCDVLPSAAQEYIKLDWYLVDVLPSAAPSVFPTIFTGHALAHVRPIRKMLENETSLDAFQLDFQVLQLFPTFLNADGDFRALQSHSTNMRGALQPSNESAIRPPGHAFIWRIYSNTFFSVNVSTNLSSPCFDFSCQGAPVQ